MPLSGSYHFVKSLDKMQVLASGGQNPFYKKGSELPKIFHWEGLDTVFSFVSLRVPSRLKTGGGFKISTTLANFLLLV